MPMDESRRVVIRHRNRGAQDVANLTQQPHYCNSMAQSKLMSDTAGQRNTLKNQKHDLSHGSESCSLLYLKPEILH